MSIDKDKLMRLPAGKTCDDCAHYRRCSWLFQCKRDATTCDWSPSRFRESRQANNERRQETK